MNRNVESKFESKVDEMHVEVVDEMHVQEDDNSNPSVRAGQSTGELLDDLENVL